MNLKFGDDGPLCAALACAYRLMGCAAPTYRIEARIIKKTGVAETCGSMIGIDDMECATYTKFIGTPPTVKRATEETDPIEAMLVAREALALWDPILYASIDFKDAPTPNAVSKKRAGFLDQLQVCSPIIGLGIDLLVSMFKVELPIDLKSLLGPCGVMCGYAVCGANILCPKQALPLITFINAQRQSGASGKVCDPVPCPGFDFGKSFLCVVFYIYIIKNVLCVHKHLITAPKSVCQNATCNNAAGQFMPGRLSATTNCLPPSTIAVATRTSLQTCCESCTSRGGLRRGAGRAARAGRRRFRRAVGL